MMVHVQLQLLSVSLFRLYRPLLMFRLILCILHSCTLHNSLNVYNIFMQFYWNIVYVKMMCHTQNMVVPSSPFLRDRL